MRTYRCDNHRPIKSDEFNVQEAATIFAKRKYPKDDYIIITIDSQSMDYKSITLNVFSGKYNRKTRSASGSNYSMTVTKD
jgi:hypothetical protein